MKILVICRPRTRSTYLIDAISSHYNITNLKERFSNPSGKFNSSVTTQKVDDWYYPIFMGNVKQQINKMFQHGDFVMKLWPRMLMLYKDDSIIPVKQITDLTYYANIKKFDNIFFLDRNLVDSACSWMYSSTIQQYTFTHTDAPSIKLSEVPNLTIDLNSPFLKLFVYEAVILGKYKEFLLNNKLAFTALDYDDVKGYIDNHFVNFQSNSVPTQFNYSEIITNYSEVKEYVSEYYEAIKYKTKDLNLK